MSDRNAINTYLNNLSRYLSRLNQADADEVLREIESHIYDAIDLTEGKGQEADIPAILEGFGSPRELAQQYTSHMIEGAPPPSGFSALRSVKRTISKGMYWSMLGLGYSFGLMFLFLALCKVFMPDQVGIWSSANGNTFVVGMVGAEFRQDNEILGIWFIPVTLMLGASLTKLTIVLQRALKHLVS